MSTCTSQRESLLRSRPDSSTRSASLFLFRSNFNLGIFDDDSDHSIGKVFPFAEIDERAALPERNNVGVEQCHCPPPALWLRS